ncbi:unnamed protein product [Protopolystoma xenopodis]|uniref:Uncharacterized protein n=1 Tax=Protopolystoma xenopodis TaxID=117903 RepID=A0A3S5AVF0_9PLAT|nr:unnamed protein product [Protopolystoma xenopodis]
MPEPQSDESDEVVLCASPIRRPRKLLPCGDKKVDIGRSDSAHLGLLYCCNSAANDRSCLETETDNDLLKGRPPNWPLQEYSSVRECLSHPPVLDESFHHLPGSVFIKSAELVVTNRILIRPRWPSLQRPEQTAEAREHVKHNHSRLPHTFNSLHVCLGMGSSTLGSYKALLLS